MKTTHTPGTKKGKKRVVIIGARIDGHAGVIADALESMPEYKLVGFIDNTPELQNKLVKGVPVLGSTDHLATIAIPADYVHIAVGDNVARGKLYNVLQKRGIPLLTIIHPSATVSKHAALGEGNYVGARVVINNGTTTGPVCIINTGAIIEHDNAIGFAVHMAPGTKTSGRVAVEDFAFVGVGATILPEVRIGSGAMIGAGSTVVKDVSPKTTVIGYAARKHNRNIYVDTQPDVGATENIYVAQPTLPEYSLLEAKFRDIAGSLMLSNFAKYSTELETVTENKLSVKKALTFPNATSGLMLALKALDLKGEVILPSFTFSATGHAVVWNGLTPVFADIDPQTFNLDPKDVERKITDKTCAILGVHVFGNPADIAALEAIAKKHNLKLIFDSAHALGSQYHGKPIGGFGDVECFSLSGTKVVTSAEGGILTSDNEELMKKIHLGRNYGAGSDYDCRYIGLNGKMSEFHAVIALESFALITKFVTRRNDLVRLYKKRLSEVPGIRFQHIPSGHVSTFKDFAVVVAPETFGMDRNALIRHLNEEGIYPKKYFYPPLHRMKAYADIGHRAEELEATDAVANNIVCLPIYSHMNVDTVEKICYSIYRIHYSHRRSQPAPEFVS